MEAIKEIGFKKSLKFIVYQIVQVALQLVFIPQLRVVLLRLCGVRIGRNSIVYNVRFMNLYRGSFKNLHIGSNCFIGDGVVFDLAGTITIEDNVTVSQESLLLTHFNIGYKNHPLQKLYPSAVSHVIVKRHSFIGVRTTILPSVTLGEYTVTGAGSVVIKTVASKKMIAGVPAKVIKSLQI